MAKPLHISIRQKPIANGKEKSLYLDFNREVWNEIKQDSSRYHFLELFVYTKPKHPLEKEHNQFVLEQAELKKFEIYKQIVSGDYGTRSDAYDKARNIDFVEFFWNQTQKRTNNTRKGWENAFKKFNTFCEGECLIRDLTANFLLDYKDFLADLKLAKNTKRTYFSVALTAINEAYKRDLLKEDLSRKVKNFSAQVARRPFLTEKEIQVLRRNPFTDSPVLTRAAFFAILTSLRWDDLRHLAYEDLQHSDELGWFIDFKIRKADRPDILYINDEAFALCEYKEKKKGRIFSMRYREKDKVIEWFKRADIDKGKGGFHIFRHTFAMRALNSGETISAVRELMGHKNTKTTEIYARLLGKTKRDAANRQSIEA